MHWYQRFWGVIIIGLGIFIGLFLVVVGSLVGYYWWQIKHGHALNLAQKFSGKFTSVLTQPANKTANVDRDQLEKGNFPSRGNPNANIIAVEFIDFKCPNCLAENPILQQVIAKYGNKIKIITRNFPAESLHPGATELAEIAYCAGGQGRYWPVHDWLFNNQNNLPAPIDENSVASLVKDTDLNAERLAECRKNPQTLTSIRADYLTAIRFGVQGTPTFFINGAKIEGAIPFSGWERILNTL